MKLARHRGLVLLAPALLLGAAPGCEPAPAGLDEETYVEVMARLAWNEMRFIDPAPAESARAAVLDRFGVTGDELIDFAERHGSDVERMYGLWERIRERVDSLDARRNDENETRLRLDTLGRAPS